MSRKNADDLSGLKAVAASLDIALGMPTAAQNLRVPMGREDARAVRALLSKTIAEAAPAKLPPQGVVV